VYYRNADVAVFVFSVACSDSFQGLEEWIATFREVVTDDTLMYVVGNKTDLVGQREVEEPVAIEWAEGFGLPLFFTSAATGDGVGALFQQIGKDVLVKSVVPKAMGMDSELKPFEKERCC
jgi:GTPase SAR1 family protein